MIKKRHIDPLDQCLKIGCAFGGGMGLQKYTCGAVTGALMAIGLHFGRGLNDDISKKEDTYKKTVEFFKEFKNRHGSIVCKELLQGLNMTDPQDRKKIEELGLFQTVCAKYIQNTVEIVERMVD